MKNAALKFLFCGLILFSLAGCGTFKIPSLTSSPSPVLKNSTPPAATISSTVAREVFFMWIAAALLAIGAGICAYLQNYFIAIKLGIAALALPICATFFELYWGWIIAGALVSGAIFIFVHYKLVLLPAIARAAAALKKI